jgi:hypothetical protein
MPSVHLPAVAVLVDLVGHVGDMDENRAGLSGITACERNRGTIVLAKQFLDGYVFLFAEWDASLFDHRQLAWM